MEQILPFKNNDHYLIFCFTKTTQIKNGENVFAINTSVTSIVALTATYNSLCPYIEHHQGGHSRNVCLLAINSAISYCKEEIKSLL